MYNSFSQVSITFLGFLLERINKMCWIFQSIFYISHMIRFWRLGPFAKVLAFSVVFQGNKSWFFFASKGKNIKIKFDMTEWIFRNGFSRLPAFIWSSNFDKTSWNQRVNDVFTCSNVFAQIESSSIYIALGASFFYKADLFSYKLFAQKFESFKCIGLKNKTKLIFLNTYCSIKAKSILKYFL